MSSPLPKSAEPLLPNDDTVDATKAARRGELVEVDSLDALLLSLNTEE